MGRRTIRSVIIIAAILLVGLILIQVVWVKKAYEIEQRHFSYEVTESLKKVVKEIQKNSGDTIPIYDPVEQLATNLYRVRIHDTLHPFYLESLLKSEFTSNEINTSFEYSIYDCFNDSVVFNKTIANPEEKILIPKASHPRGWEMNDSHYFSVLFPGRSKDLFAKMGFWVYSSIFIVIVIMFFVYTISIILRQRRLSEIKTDFINNMTHEFKTPISTISLSSEVLLKPDIITKPEKLHNYARIINNENKRLQSQVERILQIATIEKENIRLKDQQVDINDIVGKAAQTFELNAQAKEGAIEVDLSAEKSIITGDEMHLTNIISNLIDNAIKYSTNSPIVKVKTLNTKKGIEVIIEDNGVGISKAEQAQVFEKFYRVPKGNIHDVKGFGIGLHYVKVMVEQHGGFIQLESELGKGSRFKIFLPFER
tara:strand:+ start:3672 stop:4946 length:1275 start_codon:yes stop_codon:yes gene_type:complete